MNTFQPLSPMTPYPIKKHHRAGFTLMEVLVATACAVILIIALYMFFNLTRTVFSTSYNSQILTDSANTIMSQIINGKKEPTGNYSLAQGVHYCIGTGAGCTTTTTDELHYWGMDGVERWYHLNGAGTALLYYHPSASGTVDETVFSAPKGSVITLLFSPHTVNYPASNVEINVILNQTLLGRKITGTVATVVNLRNHP